MGLFQILFVLLPVVFKSIVFYDVIPNSHISFQAEQTLVERWIFYGLVIWAILYFLQPFGFCLYLGNKCLAAALFGMVTFVCYAIYIASVLKCFHRTVNPWRIWHEGIAVLGLIITIAFCNFLLSLFLFHYTDTIRLFLLFLDWTIIVGIFLTLLSVGIQYNRSLRIEWKNCCAIRHRNKRR